MKAIPLLTLVVALSAASAATAQATGDTIAGAPSPWQSAHFVLIAYALVWGAIGAYLLRLRSLVKDLRREVATLRTEHGDSE